MGPFSKSYLNEKYTHEKIQYSEPQKCFQFLHLHQPTRRIIFEFILIFKHENIKFQFFSQKY